jgi:hypothetical protein
MQLLFILAGGVAVALLLAYTMFNYFELFSER